MSIPIALRADFDAAALRRVAKMTKDAAQGRRLLALAEIYDGGMRTNAARIRERVGAMAGRTRRIAMIALWRYAEAGELPEGVAVSVAWRSLPGHIGSVAGSATVFVNGLIQNCRVAGWSRPTGAPPRA